MTRRSLPAGAGLCAVAAAVILTAGCSSGQLSSAATIPQPQAQATTVPAASTTTVEHWGAFFGGQPGNFGLEMSPAAMTLPGTVTAISTSNSTQYALLSDGSLYAWGLGTQGQLGNGGWKSSFSQPVRVRFPAGVKIASIPDDVMPYDSGLAVDTRGHVWGWGRDHGGEFCLGHATSYNAPVRLPLSHVTALAGASNHALYDAGGTLYACGQNVEGDLGDGSRSNSMTPARVTGIDGASVTRLVAAFANSGALLANGEYYDWGYDGDGQLGDGHVHQSSDVPVRVQLSDPVTRVAQGGSIWGNGQTLVMLSDGSLWGWGANRAGQLDSAVTQAQPVPTRFHAPAGVSYRSLATGSATSYAISTAGKVYAWGVSHLGQVGDGQASTALKPVLVATGATFISSTANNVLIALAP